MKFDILFKGNFGLFEAAFVLIELNTSIFINFIIFIINLIIFKAKLSKSQTKAFKTKYF